MSRAELQSLKTRCHPERSLRLFFRPASLRVGRRRSRGTCCSARSRKQNSCHTHWAGQPPRQRAQIRRSRVPLPILPQAHGRGFWFPSDGANDGDAVVVPPRACRRRRRSLTRAFRFVCLGLHTRRNAPAAAQARFSEDPLSQQLQKRKSLATPASAKVICRMKTTTAQPDTTGRLHTTRRTLPI